MTYFNLEDSYNSSFNNSSQYYNNNNTTIQSQQQQQTVTCSECNDYIDYDYYNHNGNPICLNCKLIKARTCPTCDHKVFGNALKFDDKYYHQNCFRCNICMKLLKGRKILLDNKNGACCAECLRLNKEKEKKCAKCVKPLSFNSSKSYFKAFDGDYFHTDCMKCHDCKLRFHSKDKFFRAGHDKTVLICGDCGLKRILNKLTKLFTKNDNNYP